MPPPKRKRLPDAAAATPTPRDTPRPRSPSRAPPPRPALPLPPPRPAPLELLGGDAAPLRLLLIGNNPSVATAAAGVPYAHPSNWFWRLVRAHITPHAPLPPTPAAAAALPSLAGVGLLDVGAGVVGTHLASFSSAHFAAWAPRFHERLAAHAARAGAAAGCACGECGAPLFVATTGKRQWQELVAGGGKRLPPVAYGPQPADGPRPPGWPLPPSTQVWVLPSTSGAAALSNEARAAPWAALGEEVGRVGWPRAVVCRGRE